MGQWASRTDGDPVREPSTFVDLFDPWPTFSSVLTWRRLS